LIPPGERESAGGSVEDKRQRTRCLLSYSVSETFDLESGELRLSDLGRRSLANVPYKRLQGLCRQDAGTLIIADYSLDSLCSPALICVLSDLQSNSPMSNL
jgi:hypothetical protein